MCNSLNDPENINRCKVNIYKNLVVNTALGAQLSFERYRSFLNLLAQFHYLITVLQLHSAGLLMYPRHFSYSSRCLF